MLCTCCGALHYVSYYDKFHPHCSVVEPLLTLISLGAMALASNLVFNARTKHIYVEIHFIREKVLNNDISLSFISTLDQPVDIFTKGLTSSRSLQLRDKLVCPRPVRLRGDINQTIQSLLFTSTPATNSNSSSPVKIEFIIMPNFNTHMPDNICNIF